MLYGRVARRSNIRINYVPGRLRRSLALLWLRFNRSILVAHELAEDRT